MQTPRPEGLKVRWGEEKDCAEKAPEKEGRAGRTRIPWEADHGGGWQAGHELRGGLVPNA